MLCCCNLPGAWARVSAKRISIGRLGDEFGVLLEPVDNAGNVRKLIERFRADGPNGLKWTVFRCSDLPLLARLFTRKRQYDTGLCNEAADAAMYQSKNELEFAKSGPNPTEMPLCVGH